MRPVRAGTIALAAVVLAATAALFVPARGSAEVLLPAPGERAYIAANPDFGGAEDRVSGEAIRRFERLSGRPIAWAYFSNNWLRGVNFPAADIGRIYRSGHLPFVRLMARSSFRPGGPDRRYALQSIVDGYWDEPAPHSQGLRSWCRQAAALGRPLLAEFGTEVNGDWFPWNGRWNGAGRPDRYGDPREPDGPERFRDAYRHVVDLCRAEGAKNVTWFFHVDADSDPRRRWNRIAAYYPGDAWVDWIGLSFYGSLSERWGWEQLRDGLDRAMPKLRRLGSGKPIALLEYGVREDLQRPARKARWIRAAARDLGRRWPQLEAAAWWNEEWNEPREHVDVTIDSSSRALRAYRALARDRRWTAVPRFGPR